jgi:hypothetical protein
MEAYEVEYEKWNIKASYANPIRPLSGGGCVITRDFKKLLGKTHQR